MTFQDLLLSLAQFWSRQGVVLQQPYDLEVGAGTMHPDTSFRVYRHYQFQVILKPSPPRVQDLYLESLEAFGVRAHQHDVRFEEDNWESPTLGAAGVGWQVMLDGMEISQFTYFQQAGGMELAPVSAELTYGAERIAMFLNGIENVFDLPWNATCSYGEV